MEQRMYLVAPFNMEATENSYMSTDISKSLHQDVGPQQITYEPSSFVISTVRWNFRNFIPKFGDKMFIRTPIIYSENTHQDCVGCR